MLAGMLEKGAIAAKSIKCSMDGKNKHGSELKMDEFVRSPVLQTPPSATRL